MSNGWQITISYERRRATFELPYSIPDKQIQKDTVYFCHVHGCFPYGEEGPCFVVELEDGNCICVAPAYLQFIKEEDEC